MSINQLSKNEFRKIAAKAFWPTAWRSIEELGLHLRGADFSPEFPGGFARGGVYQGVVVCKDLLERKCSRLRKQMTGQGRKLWAEIKNEMCSGNKSVCSGGFEPRTFWTKIRGRNFTFALIVKLSVKIHSFSCCLVKVCANFAEVFLGPLFYGFIVSGIALLLAVRV
jgi:hypothetical protein